jgi:hypothetical protein
MPQYHSLCIQAGFHQVVLRGVLQGWGGWGAFQRSGPTGGAAKGTPRYWLASAPANPTMVP